MGQSFEETKRGFPSPESHRPASPSWLLGAVLLTGAAHEGRGAQHWDWGWPHRHSLPSMDPNSRLQKGKQVFSTNHITFQTVLAQGTITINEEMVEILLKYKIPRPQTRADLVIKSF